MRGTRDLLTQPLWQEQDLGFAIADSPHAVSVCLPLWKHVLGYEEKDPAVISKMWGGYPRFMESPQVGQVRTLLASKAGDPLSQPFIFPDPESAQRAALYVGQAAHCIREHSGIFALDAPLEKTKAEKISEFQRHTGEIVSSRCAQDWLDRHLNSADGDAESTLRSLLSKWTGNPEDHIHLFANGMAACAHLHRSLNLSGSFRHSIQFGFAYVDTLKIQEKFPPGVRFITGRQTSQTSDLTALETELSSGDVMAVFTELTNNPLIITPDLNAIYSLCRRYGVPLIVDDTLGGYYNVDALRYADATFSSLTKYVSGACDVMGGVVLVNPKSPWCEALNQALARGGVRLYGPDALVLSKNAQDYPQRVSQINRTTRVLVEHLSRCSEVEHLYYPTRNDHDLYECIKKQEGGYGGVFSIVLKDAPQTSPAFYDALRVNKGPSLGANFTLACPFTQLAHYHELDWAESCGVSRWLIRVSVGLETPDDLCARFDEALNPPAK